MLSQIQLVSLNNIGALITSFQAYLTSDAGHKPTLSKYCEIDSKHSILSDESKGVPILIIPSLINHYHILDLDGNNSFIQKLQDKGFKVFLLDWHTSEPESFEVCSRVIKDTITKINADTKSKVHLLGHCMGGILCLPILNDCEISSFISIASPVTFENAKFQFFAKFIKDAGSPIPNGSLIRDFFYLAKPYSISRHFIEASIDNKNPDFNLWAKITNWVNNTPNLHQNILRQCSEDLITQNTFLKDVTSNVKSIVIAGKYDSISPLESTIDASAMLTNSIMKVFDTGHVGLLTAKSDELTNFIAQHTIN